MSISWFKVESPQIDDDRHEDATKSAIKNTSLSDEIESWEKTYRERFSRSFIFRWGTRNPLWNVQWKPDLNRYPWKFAFQNTAPRYAGPTPEPISAELAARTRWELISSYHDKMMFGGIVDTVRATWSPKGTLGLAHVPYRSHGDALPHEIGLYEYEDLIHSPWFNQTTAVYFEPDFMCCCYGMYWGEGHELDVYWGDGCPYIARALLAAWLDVHRSDGEIPNSQQGRYFAKPFLLEGRPSDHGAIRDTVYTHKLICKAIQKAQNQPASRQDPHTWEEHGCEMGPIYRSVIIVIDKQPALRQGRHPAEQRNILFEQCSVLLIRTGDEDHLSAPIDFSALTDYGLNLPLGRSEGELPNLNKRQEVVRVRIPTAVRFIMNLEKRERIASARLTAIKKILDVETFRQADTWASAILADAEVGGIDRVADSWKAVRLAQAHLDGDRCGLEDPPFQDRHSLRTWFYI